MPTVLDAIKEYLAQISKYEVATKNFAQKLLLGEDSLPGVNSYVLKFILESKKNCATYLPKADISDKSNILALEDAIFLSLQLYTHNKLKAKNIYENFLTYVNKKYDLKISPSFPQIPSASDLERMLSITKLLQGKTIYGSHQQIAAYFGVSSKTIRKDFEILRGERPDKKLIVLGQKLEIDYKKKGGKYTTESTLHPFFLTFNLTQVLTLLEGLRLMSREPRFQEYAQVTACSIWNQLSLYAQNRIIEDLPSKLDIDLDWYNSLDDLNEKAFFKETEFTMDHLLDFLKNGKPVNVHCNGTDKVTKIYKNCHIKHYESGVVTIELQDKSVIAINEADIFVLTASE